MEELEVLRKKYLFSLIVLVVIVLVLLVLFYAFFGFDSELISLFSFLLVFFIVLYLYLNRKKKEAFERQYKKVVVIDVMREVFTDVKFNYDKGLPISVIRGTDMMHTGNIYNSNDLFSGKYKNVNFSCSDITIGNETTDSDGNTSTTYYFIGQWYIFDFNKCFRGEFQVCENSFRHSNKKTGFLGIGKVNDIVEVEDVEFNKTFSVYASDPHSVFYVLTPKIIESIKQINEEVSGKLLFCFIGSKLHVGVYSGKDNFKVSAFHKVDLEKAKEKIKKELLPITNFIDKLDLDNDIFKTTGN